MVIRPMKEEDLPRVLEIEKETFPTPWGKWAFLVELKPPGHAYVCEIQDRVVGYLVLRIIADEAHLMNIAVDRPWRGKGMGKAMLRFAIDLCSQKGVTSLWLEVRESNHAAIALYRKMGFVLVGRRRRYYQDTGEDALLMELFLGGKAVADKRRTQNP